MNLKNEIKKIEAKIKSKNFEPWELMDLEGYLAEVKNQQEKENKVYVSMTDKFMSNWGKAENKNNKLIFICSSYEEAQIVEENAKNRNDQKYVRISFTFPNFNKSKNYVQIKTKGDYSSWYEKGFFKIK